MDRDRGVRSRILRRIRMQPKRFGGFRNHADHLIGRRIRLTGRRHGRGQHTFGHFACHGTGNQQPGKYERGCGNRTGYSHRLTNHSSTSTATCAVPPPFSIPLTGRAGRETHTALTNHAPRHQFPVANHGTTHRSGHESWCTSGYLMSAVVQADVSVNGQPTGRRVPNNRRKHGMNEPHGDPQ